MCLAIKQKEKKLLVDALLWLDTGTKTGK